MRAAVILILLSTCASAFAEDESYEFKGIALGASLASVESDPKFQCGKANDADTRLVADDVCQLKYGVVDTIAGARIKVLSLYFMGGALQTIAIYFDSENFAQVEDALTQKYGQGSRESQEIQNRMGATFTNETVTWTRPGQALIATRYAGSLTRSSVMYRLDAALEEYARRRAAAAQQRSGDL